MAMLKFYQTAEVIPDPAGIFAGHILDDDTPGGPVNHTMNTGWRPGGKDPGPKESAGLYAWMSAGVEVGPFGAVNCPGFTITQCNTWMYPEEYPPYSPGRRAFRSKNPLSGIITTGSWEMRALIRATAGSGWGTGSLGMTVWASKNPEGGNSSSEVPLLLTSGNEPTLAQSSYIAPALTAKLYTALSPYQSSTRKLVDEYLFFCIFWQIGTQGTNSLNNVRIYIPSNRENAIFSSPDFIPFKQVSFAGLDDSLYFAPAAVDFTVMPGTITVNHSAAQEIQSVANIESDSISIETGSAPVEIGGFEVAPIVDSGDVTVGFSPNETNWRLGEYFI